MASQNQKSSHQIPLDWPEAVAAYDPTAISEFVGDTNKRSDDESKKKSKIKAHINSFIENDDDLMNEIVHCPVCFATRNRKRFRGLKTLFSHASSIKEEVKFHRVLKERLTDKFGW